MLQYVHVPAMVASKSETTVDKLHSKNAFLSALYLEQSSLLGVSPSSALSLFRAAKDGSVKDMENAISNSDSSESICYLNKTPVQKIRDPLGASITHTAYFYKNYKVGRYLVERYPLSAMDSYSPTLTNEYTRKKASIGEPSRLLRYMGKRLPHAGLTVLHLLAMQGNTEEMVWFLDFQLSRVESFIVSMLRSRVTGSFYQYGTTCGQYSGETPFHFAVCSGNIQVVGVLLEYMERSKMDDLFATDRVGNSALHLCVLKTLPRMFCYLIAKAKEMITLRTSSTVVVTSNAEKSEKTVVETALLRHLFTHVFNNDGHSALTLAAVDGNVTMFRLFFSSFEEVDHEQSVLKELQTVVNSIDTSLRAIRSDLFAQTSTDVRKLTGHPQESVAKAEVEPQYGQMRRQRWKVGTLTSSLVELDGLDVPHEESQRDFLAEPFRPAFDACLSLFSVIEVEESAKVYSNGKPFAGRRPLKSALDWLALSETSLQVFGVEEVHKLVMTKWNSTYKGVYNIYGIGGLAFAVSLTAAAIVSGNRLGFVVAYILALAAFSTQFYEEFMELVVSGRAYFNDAPKAAALYQRLYVWVQVALLIVGVVSHVAQFGNSESIGQANGKTFATAVSLVLAWLNMFYFLFGFEIGCFVIVLIEITIAEVKRFMQAFVILLIAFGTALSAVAQYSYNDSGSPYNVLGQQVVAHNSIDRLFAILYNFEILTIGILSRNFSVLDDQYVPEHLKWLFVLLTITFIILANLLLFNLLIAMMTHSYSKILEEAKLVQTREIANIIQSSERGFGRRAKQFIARNTYVVDIDRANLEFPHGPYFEMYSYVKMKDERLADEAERRALYRETV